MTQRNAARDARVAARKQEIAKLPTAAAKQIFPDAKGINGSVHSVIGDLPECPARPPLQTR